MEINEVLSEREKEEQGWMFRCRLIKKVDNFRDKKSLFNAMFGGDSASIEKAFGKCIQDITDEADWKPFFEMFKCLSEETQKMKKAYEPVEKMQKKCYAKHDVLEINIEDPQISKKNQESYGCYAKCIHEGLGSFSDGAFYPQNFAKSFTSDIQDIIVKTMESCEKEVEKKFQGKDKGTCEYFFDYNLCTHKEEFMRNL